MSIRRDRIRIIPLFAVAFLGLLAQACSGTDAASQPDEESVGHAAAAAQVEARTIANIVAAAETTASTKIVSWRLSRAGGGEFAIAGLGIDEKVLSDLRLRPSKVDGALSLVLRDVRSGRFLQLNGETLVANTFADDPRSMILLRRAQADFDKYNASSGGTSADTSRCDFTVALAAAFALGAGAGCVPCAGAAIGLGGSAIINCY